MKNKKSVLVFLGLHALFMIYSLSSVCSKMAASVEFLSLQFCCLYAGTILLLGIYAVGWQQIIKYLPLTTAFANKAVTVVWGMIWGLLFFDERITLGKTGGIVFVMIGIILFATERNIENHE